MGWRDSCTAIKREGMDPISVANCDCIDGNSLVSGLLLFYMVGVGINTPSSL